MPQSGQEMLDETISTCKSIADGLGTQNQDWENSVVEIVEKFEEVSETFFFKTMPSVPVTRTAMRDAALALELKNANDWDGMKAAVETLIASSQNLIEKAGMKGTTLT
ncbi:MAG TPA: hypothetical protein DEP04_05345 [Dehalococcoidia bacterium]|jgi:hypothetical protein|nr:hypothetical protein [Chloroflexota bacterium]HCE76035.1 hypothetical protein [Dehalococcoidia bacterium]|tara:strand:- start:4512 stop:4835 length:324 start_codon:yes stop_codon:yes gene_type:complete